MSDPLEVLDDLLREEGSTIEEAYFAHIGRNATWDYEHEDWYEDWITAYGGWSGDSHRPAGRTDGETTGWVTAERYLPRTFGSAFWELRSLPEGGTVSFDGRVDTDLPGQWHARAFRSYGAGSGQLRSCCIIRLVPRRPPGNGG